MGAKIEVTVDDYHALVAHNKLFCDTVQDRVCELSCFGPSWSPRQAIDGDDRDHMVAHKVLGGYKTLPEVQKSSGHGTCSALEL